MPLSMKKILLLLVCLLTSLFSANAKYWICTLNTDQHMKDEPIVDGGKVLCLVPGGEYVVIDDEDRKNGFVYALWVNGDVYGYLTEAYITKVQELETSQQNVLQETGRIRENDPEIEIKNKCEGKITVSVNGNKHSFKPGETQKIVVPAGKISIFVSTPGMLPFSSHQYVKAGRSYKWTFYIKRDKESHN